MLWQSRYGASRQGRGSSPDGRRRSKAVSGTSIPKRTRVFIATQDMALSRALNRGYAAPRARWPMEFGLLSHDVLWVLDEVQLMDVGLATSAQLQAFFDDDAKAGRSIRPRLSWWMSATLQPDWLRTVDTIAHHAAWIEEPASDRARATPTRARGDPQTGHDPGHRGDAGSRICRARRRSPFGAIRWRVRAHHSCRLQYGRKSVRDLGRPSRARNGSRDSARTQSLPPGRAYRVARAFPREGRVQARSEPHHRRNTGCGGGRRHLSDLRDHRSRPVAEPSATLWSMRALWRSGLGGRGRPRPR